MGEERRGRPRSASVHQAILRAARELLAEEGYARLSMDRVAARAGVGKQTLYRRWPSKAPLVAEAVLDSAWPAAAFPADTGDVRRDLRHWLHGQAGFLASPQNAVLIRALAAAAAAEPGDAQALYEQLTGPGRDMLVKRLRAGVSAGQLRPGADLDAAADALTGALIYQVLAGDSTGITAQRADGLLDVIMSGLRAGGPDPS